MIIVSAAAIAILLVCIIVVLICLRKFKWYVKTTLNSSKFQGFFLLTFNFFFYKMHSAGKGKRTASSIYSLVGANDILRMDVKTLDQGNVQNRFNETWNILEQEMT